MNRKRSFFAALAGTSLLLVGCGGSDSSFPFVPPVTTPAADTGQGNTALPSTYVHARLAVTDSGGGTCSGFGTGVVRPASVIGPALFDGVGGYQVAALSGVENSTCTGGAPLGVNQGPIAPLAGTYSVDAMGSLRLTETAPTSHLGRVIGTQGVPAELALYASVDEIGRQETGVLYPPMTAGGSVASLNGRYAFLGVSLAGPGGPGPLTEASTTLGFFQFDGAGTVTVTIEAGKVGANNPVTGTLCNACATGPYTVSPTGVLQVQFSSGVGPPTTLNGQLNATGDFGALTIRTGGAASIFYIGLVPPGAMTPANLSGNYAGIVHSLQFTGGIIQDRSVAFADLVLDGVGAVNGTGTANTRTGAATQPVQIVGGTFTVAADGLTNFGGGFGSSQGYMALGGKLILAISTETNTSMKFIVMARP